MHSPTSRAIVILAFEAAGLACAYCTYSIVMVMVMQEMEDWVLQWGAIN